MNTQAKKTKKVEVINKTISYYFNASDFTNFIKKASKIKNNSNTVAILDNVAFKDNKVIFSDIETTIVLDLIHPFSFCIDFNMFKKIISIAKNFEVIQEGLNVVFKTFDTEIKLKAFEIDDYITLTTGYNMEQGEYLPFYMLENILKSVGKDVVDRKAMTGVHIDPSVGLVSTNAHILQVNYFKNKLSENLKGIAPKVFFELIDTDSYINADKDFYKWNNTNLSVISRKINMEFIDYDYVIPKFNVSSFASIEIVLTKEILNAIELSTVTMNKVTELIRVDVTKDNITISTSDSTFDVESKKVIEVQSVCEKDLYSFGFNYSWFKLLNFKEGDILLQETQSRAIISKNNDNLKLLCPLLLN